MSLFKERAAPISFPCWMELNGESLTIASKEHYDYLNDKADKLYQVFYGYRSQPELDYFCSNHPQENNCFAAALIMDGWCQQHDFNQDKE